AFIAPALVALTPSSSIRGSSRRRSSTPQVNAPWGAAALESQTDALYLRDRWFELAGDRLWGGFRWMQIYRNAHGFAHFLRHRTDGRRHLSFTSRGGCLGSFPAPARAFST